MKFTQLEGKKGVGEPLSKFTAVKEFAKYETYSKSIQEHRELDIDKLNKNLRDYPEMFKINEYIRSRVYKSLKEGNLQP